MHAVRISGQVMTRIAAIVVAITPLTAHAQSTAALGGRVTDRETGEPVEGVSVHVSGRSAALTDEGGVFVVRDLPAGEHVITLEHLTYGTHTRQVLLEEGAELALDVRISSRAIELQPLVVESLSELEIRRRTSGNSINEVLAPEIERADRAGMNLSQLLQGSMPGVLVRAGFGGQTCVTYRAIRSDNDRGDCDGVGVVLDGVPVADPSYVYASIPLRDIARLEMMSPGQGGVRYGMRSGQSILLIETKQGMDQRRARLDDLMTGLDWEGESEPYALLSVFGSAFLANAIGVGVGLALADRCFANPETASQFALRTHCPGVQTAGATIVSVTLPAIAGSLAARRSGRTDRSQGRTVPSFVISGMLLTGGYLLLIGGDGPAEKTGAVVLTLAVPVAMTFSDRVFRVLR